jgi:hypothetical protein
MNKATVVKSCIYCVETFTAETEFGDRDASYGICDTCEDKINNAGNPNHARLTLEFEAARNEMNAGRRV